MPIHIALFAMGLFFEFFFLEAMRVPIDLALGA